MNIEQQNIWRLSELKVLQYLLEWVGISGWELIRTQWQVLQSRCYLVAFAWQFVYVHVDLKVNDAGIY